MYVNFSENSWASSLYVPLPKRSSKSPQETTHRGFSGKNGCFAINYFVCHGIHGASMNIGCFAFLTNLPDCLASFRFSGRTVIDGRFPAGGRRYARLRNTALFREGKRRTVAFVDLISKVIERYGETKPIGSDSSPCILYISVAVETNCAKQWRISAAYYALLCVRFRFSPFAFQARSPADLSLLPILSRVFHRVYPNLVDRSRKWVTNTITAISTHR